jgi:hypothetical protein
MIAHALILASAAGQYVGEGIWYEEGGDSKKYRIEMRIEALPNGDVQQWFKHTFFEEGGNVIEKTFNYHPIGNGIFELSVAGAPLAGKGYCSKSVCHYTLPVPNNTVEGTQIFSDNGQIIGIGSAEKNAKNRYIWWEERVVRK